MNFLQKITVVVACFASNVASAALIPNSYDVSNGSTGSYTYWDDSYTGGKGCLTCDNASLSGGHGDLTDGIIARDNWFVAEAPTGAGPYVGWKSDPQIVFHWNTVASIDSVTFYLDDANGFGMVGAPESVTVNGHTFAITDPAGSGPFSFTARGIAFSGNDLIVSIKRKNTWVFLSEVQFDGLVTAVPEPGTILLLMMGLGALVTGRRRKHG